MPLLREVYGEGFAHALTGLARESSQCRMLVQPQLLDPLWRAVHHSPLAIWVDLEPYAQVSPRRRQTAHDFQTRPISA